MGILFVIKIVQLFFARNYDNTEKFLLTGDLSSYWVFRNNCLLIALQAMLFLTCYKDWKESQ